MFRFNGRDCCEHQSEHLTVYYGYDMFSGYFLMAYDGESRIESICTAFPEDSIDVVVDRDLFVARMKFYSIPQAHIEAVIRGYPLSECQN